MLAEAYVQQTAAGAVAGGGGGGGRAGAVPVVDSKRMGKHMQWEFENLFLRVNHPSPTPQMHIPYHTHAHTTPHTCTYHTTHAHTTPHMHIHFHTTHMSTRHTCTYHTPHTTCLLQNCSRVSLKGHLMSYVCISRVLLPLFW